MNKPESGRPGDDKNDEGQSAPEQASSSLTDDDLDQMIDQATERAAQKAGKPAADEAKKDAAEEKQVAAEDRKRAEEVEVKDAPSRAPAFLLGLLTKQNLLIGIPSLLFIALMAAFALQEPASPPVKRPIAKEPAREAWSPRVTRRDTVQVVKVDTPKVEVARVDSAAIREQQTRGSILGIAPDVYYRVDLNVREDPTLTIPSTPALERTEIFVRAGPWDKLSRPARVEVLNETSSILRERYASSARQVRLIFDDGRKSLDFRIN